MWIFYTTSLGDENELKNSDLWYAVLPIAATCETRLTVHSEGTTVYDVLEKGFNDLMELCDVVTEKFTVARDEFDLNKRR